MQDEYSPSQIVNYELAEGVAEVQLDDDPDFRKSLKSRGKGTYVCPRGADCTKGGVRPDGDLVVFHRNSEYR